MKKDIRKKEYVQVTAIFTSDGKVVPKQIMLKDGRTYFIDKITDVRRAPALKTGGKGIRYTCLIWGKYCYVFYEENFKWFIEMKVS